MSSSPKRYTAWVLWIFFRKSQKIQYVGFQRRSIDRSTKYSVIFPLSLSPLRQPVISSRYHTRQTAGISPAEFSLSLHITSHHSKAKKLDVTVERLMFEHSYGSLSVSRQAIRSESRYSNKLWYHACVASWSSSLLRRSHYGRTTAMIWFVPQPSRKECVHIWIVMYSSTVVANQRGKTIRHKGSTSIQD